MNKQRRMAVRGVSEFILRAAPAGAIEWAKANEPHRSKIAAAQKKAGDATIPLKTALRSYAGAFFTAFREYFDQQHPGTLDPKTVKCMSLSEIWHAGHRLTAVPCTSDIGTFTITPRRSDDLELQPTFSAAELMLLQVLGISHRLMVDAGLADADDGAVEGALAVVMATKMVFPGAYVTDVIDSLGDRHPLLPAALVD